MYTYRFTSYKRIEVGTYRSNGTFRRFCDAKTFKHALEIVDFKNSEISRPAHFFRFDPSEEEKESPDDKLLDYVYYTKKRAICDDVILYKKEEK